VLNWNDAKPLLDAPLNRAHVKERSQSGRTLSYVEGWHVIAEANRIFGHGAWHRETIEMREVRPPEIIKNNYGKETWRVGYMARVRVTVGDVIREGTGFGSGAMPDLGDAMESAIKEAETDAMKRAFMTFGNPFGLALYDKSQENVIDDAKPATDAPRTSAAQLKRDDVLGQLRADLVDCTTLVRFEACKAEWREKAKREGWPKLFLEGIKEELESHEAALMQAIEAAEMVNNVMAG
jgi:DNA recombination protein Rad52